MLTLLARGAAIVSVLFGAIMPGHRATRHTLLGGGRPSGAHADRRTRDQCGSDHGCQEILTKRTHFTSVTVPFFHVKLGRAY